MNLPTCGWCRQPVHSHTLPNGDKRWYDSPTTLHTCKTGPLAEEPPA